MGRVNSEIKLGDPGQDPCCLKLLVPNSLCLSRLPYHGYLGGVFALRPTHYLRINGFPNSYWYWDHEDHDIAARWGALLEGRCLTLAWGCRSLHGVGDTGRHGLKGSVWHRDPIRVRLLASLPSPL